MFYLREDFELVQIAVVQPGDEELPDSREAAAQHRMRAAIPMIKIADDAYTPRVRRPHTEMHAAHAVDFANVRSQFFVIKKVRAFADQMKIEFCKQRRKCVCVVAFFHVATGVSNSETISCRVNRF